jgi:hypothetical protein
VAWACCSYVVAGRWNTLLAMHLILLHWVSLMPEGAAAAELTSASLRLGKDRLAEGQSSQSCNAHNDHRDRVVAVDGKSLTSLGEGGGVELERVCRGSIWGHTQ